MVTSRRTQKGKRWKVKSDLIINPKAVERKRRQVFGLGKAGNDIYSFKKQRSPVGESQDDTANKKKKKTGLTVEKTRCRENFKT